MAWGASLTADNTVPTQGPTLHHVEFPRFSFDARLWPYVPVPPVPTENEAAVLQALEDAATAPPPEVALAERTLIEIAGNKFMAEATRVRASQLILERYDQRVLIAQLQKELEELKRTKLEEFEAS